MQNNTLSGKVAIVTGATSGIGRAVVKDLAEVGVKVVATARRTDRLNKLKAESSAIKVLPGDITDPDMPDKLIDKAKEDFNRCDILIHAAGVLHMGNIEDVNIDDMCRQVRINLEASVRITYKILRHFKSIGSGQLIHLSSILGTKVREGTGVYAGTKYGIEALVEALRMELANTGINICAIQPGVTITELHDNMPVHPQESLGISSPLQPEDIVRCVRFILEQPEHVRIPALMVLPGEQAI